VIELSETLNRLAHADRDRSPTHRDANGVTMKLLNFRPFDPDYTASGRVGLHHTSRVTSRVWRELATDPCVCVRPQRGLQWQPRRDGGLSRPADRAQNPRPAERPCPFDGPFPGHPLYRGNPWFLPAVGAWHRLRDALDSYAPLTTQLRTARRRAARRSIQPADPVRGGDLDKRFAECEARFTWEITGLLGVQIVIFSLMTKFL
jgi:hypothetical protein